MYCYLLLVQKEMHQSAVCWLPDSDENVLIQRQREENERGVDLNTVYIYIWNNKWMELLFGLWQICRCV